MVKDVFKYNLFEQEILNKLVECFKDLPDRYFNARSILEYYRSKSLLKYLDIHTFPYDMIDFGLSYDEIKAEIEKKIRERATTTEVFEAGLEEVRLSSVAEEKERKIDYLINTLKDTLRESTPDSRRDILDVFFSELLVNGFKSEAIRSMQESLSGMGVITSSEAKEVMERLSKKEIELKIKTEELKRTQEELSRIKKEGVGVFSSDIIRQIRDIAETVKETKEDVSKLRKAEEEAGVRRDIVSFVCSCGATFILSVNDVEFLQFLGEYRRSIRGTVVKPDDYLTYCEDCLKKMLGKDYLSFKMFFHHISETYLNDPMVEFQKWKMNKKTMFK